MATPKFVTDGSTEFEESEMNRAIMSDGVAVQVKAWHAHVRYDGANVEVDSSIDSAGFTTAAVAFNSTDTTFDITLSGWTNPPVIMLTPGTPSAYVPHVYSVTNTLARVGFRDIDTGAEIVTGTEDTDMDFNIIAIGF